MWDDDDRVVETVPRHDMDAFAIEAVEAGSVAPTVYRIPMPPVRADGPNFARSFGGELLARALIWDAHAVNPQSWFYAEMASRTVTDRFRAAGIESGFDRHDRVAGWRAAFWWAVIARDEDALRELASYPIERLREYGGTAFDECHYEWARILQDAWRYGPDAVTEQAWGIDTTSRLGAQSPVSQLLRPSIEVFARLAARDQNGFSWELANGLRAHRTFFDTDTWRHDPEATMSLPLLGLACWAHDLGMSIDVESEYLPLGFVYRPDWLHSPELAEVQRVTANTTPPSPPAHHD
ncbi:immunity 49 family protein [Nocardia jejuensis]|uniref:immunity 49 family protein n=1 Tax=Nocardia jejuensis TaxID=328049 RepID=UPI000833809B|nr:immunity 49 family protein [Nocardia jejuensis]